MNENLANEIRKTIESVKDLKIETSGINNHLASLEGLVRFDNQKKVDEAYQRGYDKGYEDKANNDEVCKELAKDIYQRGLNDAWEAARRIVLNPEDGGMSLTDIYLMFGHRSIQSVLKNYSASEAIAKLKAYEEKQKVDEENGNDRGKWKDIVEGIEYAWGTCDKCGARIPMAYKYYEYCPHCGMKNEVTE